MATYQAVTTFSREGYLAYGKQFVDQWVDRWPIPLVVYHESQPEVTLHPNLEWRNLDYDSDRALFIAQHKDSPERVGTWKDPNSQSIRFCHKIFAITNAAKSCLKDWLIWIDADVTTNRPVYQSDLEKCLPADASLSFLGRLRYKYTECGFIGYRVADPRVRAMLDDMRSYYSSGEIFTRPKSDWHDSRCFDICRSRSSIPKEQQHSMTPAALPTTHVWQHSPLGAFSEHHKGPGRKQRTYGQVVP